MFFFSIQQVLFFRFKMNKNGLIGCRKNTLKLPTHFIFSAQTPYFDAEVLYIWGVITWYAITKLTLYPTLFVCMVCCTFWVTIIITKRWRGKHVLTVLISLIAILLSPLTHLLHKNGRVIYSILICVEVSFCNETYRNYQLFFNSLGKKLCLLFLVLIIDTFDANKTSESSHLFPCDGETLEKTTSNGVTFAFFTVPADVEFDFTPRPAYKWPCYQFSVPITLITLIVLVVIIYNVATVISMRNELKNKANV